MRFRSTQEQADDDGERGSIAETELLIAKNPDEGSSLPYLLRIPLAGVPILRARDVWPRTNAVYCHPVADEEWPTKPEVVESVELRVCERRGAAIDIVATRSRRRARLPHHPFEARITASRWPAGNQRWVREACADGYHGQDSISTAGTTGVGLLAMIAPSQALCR